MTWEGGRGREHKNSRYQVMRKCPPLGFPCSRGAFF